MQNILFVLYHDFSSNSAIHVHNFANSLANQGLDCTVAVPYGKETVSGLGRVLYKTINFSEAARIEQSFSNRQGPDIVHAWTPREVVREFCDRLQQRFRFKLVVHLEDNEELLLKAFTGKSADETFEHDQDTFPKSLSHPQRYRKFLNQSDGVTIIMDRLEEFVPGNISALILWPGVETSMFYPRPPNVEKALELGVPLNSTIICYTGNVHLANAREVRSLYLAIALLNREGYPTTLVRSGRDSCTFLGDSDIWAKKYVVDLGYLKEHRMLPEILAIADILIQPGRADPFNDYRLPSKLPEFLAMGKPVIVPKTNIGRFMETMHHAIVLPSVDAIGIVETVKHLHTNPALRDRLGQGAVEFVKTHLSWTTNSKKLLSYYEKIFQRTASTHL